jgi:rubrerythrin
MKTSSEWWNSIKNDPEKIVSWLKTQYHGEATASVRVREFRDKFATSDKQKRLLSIIADQEEKHANWVAELLKNRGVEPALLAKDERYWNETLGQIDSFESGAAVAAHAEQMRLERIKAIAFDQTSPRDIRKVFNDILIDEMMHASVFRQLTTDEAFDKTNEAHVKGLEALGLVI